MPDPIADVDQQAPSAGELAMADTALQLALGSRLAAHSPDGCRLTWAGLHALAALGAMLDNLTDSLVAEGHGLLLLGLADVPSRAFAAVHLLDDSPELAARLLATGGPE